MNRSAAPTRRRGARLAAGLTAALVLAGCGGGSPASGGPAQSSGGKNVTVRVAVQAIADFSPVWLGVSHGFFNEQGITVTIVPGTASSSGQIPLLSSGQADMAATTATAALQAAGQGIPVSIVGGLTTFGTTAASDQSGLIVAKGSPIRSYPNLAGKTVAISGLKSVTQAAIEAAVAKAGSDPGSVKFIQIPMPNIASTVGSGGADAGFVVDPFLGAATSAGASVIGHPLSDVAPGEPATSLVATKEYASKDAATLKKFRAALAKAVAYCNAHPDEVLAATAKGAKVPLQLLKGSKNPVFDANVDPALLSKESKLLQTYGALENAVDPSSIVWKG